VRYGQGSGASGASSDQCPVALAAVPAITTSWEVPVLHCGFATDIAIYTVACKKPCIDHFTHPGVQPGVPSQSTKGHIHSLAGL
jgi:hypothetical protein